MTLEPFGGRKVDEVAIRIVGAGDGLSDALGISPVELDHDEIIHVILRCRVTKVSYEEVKDSENLRRVHTARALAGSLVDDDYAGRVLDDLRSAVEEAQGIRRLPGT